MGEDGKYITQLSVPSISSRVNKLSDSQENSAAKVKHDNKGNRKELAPVYPPGIESRSSSGQDGVRDGISSIAWQSWRGSGPAPLAVIMA